MVKNHMKRLTMPKTWPVDRKNTTFVFRPQSGKDFRFSMPLGTVVKELIKAYDTSREVTAMYNQKKILVNGKPVYDLKYPVGLFDVVTLVENKENFRLILDSKGRLMTTAAKDADKYISRIANKTTIRGGKTQINCMNGVNVLVDKDSYKTGDSVIIADKKIVDHFPLTKGNTCMLILGKHGGSLGTIENIDGNRVTVKTKNGSFETLKEYAFVVGKDKPAVSLE